MADPGLVALMPSASEAERTEVEARCVLREVAAGEVVVREGDASSMLALVRSGRLAVSTIRGEVTVALADVDAGDWTGEVALLDPGPAAVTLTGAEATTLLTLDANGLARLATECPVAASALLAGLSGRLAQRLRTASIPSLTAGAEGAVRADEPAPPPPAKGWVAELIGRLFGGAA